LYWRSKSGVEGKVAPWMKSTVLSSVAFTPSARFSRTKSLMPGSTASME